jgi:hypothetical protein
MFALAQPRSVQLTDRLPHLCHICARATSCYDLGAHNAGP